MTFAVFCILLTWCIFTLPGGANRTKIKQNMHLLAIWWSQVNDKEYFLMSPWWLRQNLRIPSILDIFHLHARSQQMRSNTWRQGPAKWRHVEIRPVVCKYAWKINNVHKKQVICWPAESPVFHLQMWVDGSWDAHWANLMGPSSETVGPLPQNNGSQISKFPNLKHV